MMEKSSSQYDSFLFWRQPIPELALSELEDLSDFQPANSSRGNVPSSKPRSSDKEGELLKFSSFNYWRAPIADVDALLADLHLLL